MGRGRVTAEHRLAKKREYNRRWALANPDKVKASRKKYEAANKQKIAEYKSAAQKADPKKFTERRKAWIRKNPEKAKLQWARYYEANKERLVARAKAWQAANPDWVSEYGSRRRASPEFKAWRSQYCKKKYSNDVQFRLATLLRNRIRKIVRGETKPESSIEALGCTLSEFKKHIESRFQFGMSWGNQGLWHLDHIKPLAGFDMTDPEQYRAACNYKNLQPLWGRDNQSKGTRDDSRRAQHKMD